VKGIIMLTQNGTNLNGSNGVHAAKLYPACASDYDAVTIDITPQTAPKPGWRDQHAAFTHHIQWIDADGISHGLTLRSDSLQGLMADLKMVKGMIKAAKQKAAESQPQQAMHDPQVPAADVPDTKHCAIHGVDMARRWSKRTGGHYFAHKAPTGDFCYGRAPKA
jgi:hypothetical protein